MKLFTVRNGVAVEAPPKVCRTCQQPGMVAHEKYFRRLFKKDGSNNGFSRDCLKCERAFILKRHAEKK